MSGTSKAESAGIVDGREWFVTSRGRLFYKRDAPEGRMPAGSARFVKDADAPPSARAVAQAKRDQYQAARVALIEPVQAQAAFDKWYSPDAKKTRRVRGPDGRLQPRAPRWKSPEAAKYASERDKLFADPLNNTMAYTRNPGKYDYEGVDDGPLARTPMSETRKAELQAGAREAHLIKKKYREAQGYPTGKVDMLGRLQRAQIDSAYKAKYAGPANKAARTAAVARGYTQLGGYEGQLGGYAQQQQRGGWAQQQQRGGQGQQEGGFWW